MSGFDERKNASEKKHVLEAAQVFKAEARRNKKLAHWVAALIGKNEDETAKYVTEVIVADMEEAGDDDVFRKLRADLDAAGADVTDVALRDKMNAMMDEASAEIAADS